MDSADFRDVLDTAGSLHQARGHLDSADTVGSAEQPERQGWEHRVTLDSVDLRGIAGIQGSLDTVDSRQQVQELQVTAGFRVIRDSADSQDTLGSAD